MKVVYEKEVQKGIYFVTKEQAPINEISGSEDAITLISIRKIGLDFKRPSDIQKMLVLPFNHRILLRGISNSFDE